MFNNYRKFLLLTLSLFLSFSSICYSQNVESQEVTKTNITLQSGLDESVRAELEEKVEQLLLQVNELTLNEINKFNEEPAIEKLVKLINERKFVSNLDDIHTYIISTDDNTWEVPKLFVRPLEGNEFSYEELQLIFSKDAELVDARLAGKETNYERILRRSSEADAQEREAVEAIVEEYIKAFQEKDVFRVSNIFSNTADIITGSRRKSDGVVVFERYSYDDYMKRLEERILTSYNTISIHFEEENIYRHPDFINLYGFSAKQYYVTPSYSDTGYTFMIFDIEGESPKLISRYWQENPFQLSAFSEVIAPKPRKLEARLTDVRTRVDNSNLSLTKTMPRDQGLLQIELETNDLSLINAHIAEEWINENILTFTNLDLLTDFIEIIDSTNIRVPFKTEWKQGMQRVGTELAIRGTSVIDDFKSNQSLYLQRLNIMTVKILSREEEKELEEKALAAANDTTSTEESEYDFAKEFAFEGKVKFKTNVDNINVRILTDGDQLLMAELQPKKSFEYQLLEGDYKVEFTRNGYITRVIDILILRTEIMEHHLIMREVK